MGCDRDAYTVRNSARPITFNGQTFGRIELRWSPSCGTNWGRASFYDGNPNGEHLPIWISVQYSDGSQVKVVTFQYNGSGSPVWGNMLYAPGVCTTASADRDQSYGDATGTSGQGC